MPESNRDRMDEYIRRLVDQAPPLTDDQRRRLAAILNQYPYDDTDMLGESTRATPRVSGPREAHKPEGF